MEGHGSLTHNVIDKSNDVYLGLFHGPASVGTFVNGSKENGGFSAVGVTASLQGTPGGVSVTGAHIPDFGKQVTASAHLNILKHNDHKVAVNAFTTSNHPTGPIPAYKQKGGGVTYAFGEKAAASASIIQTPIAKMTERSVSGSLNLHSTPTSSLDLNAHVKQVQTPFGHSPRQHGASITFVKRF